MTEALVSPEIITWARGRRKMTEDEVARSIKIKPERVRRWESGEEKPTFRQAQRLAHILKIPFGYLYLSAPPKERMPVPDLRTIGGREEYGHSADFLDLVNALRRKQDWYSEYLREQGAEPLSFIGSYSAAEEPSIIAHQMRDILGADRLMRKAAKSWSDYLYKLAVAAENNRILVLRSGIVGNNTRRKLNVEEFRGLTLVDEFAPMVFINAADAKSAQIFTLVHELAHLWIGQSGVSDITVLTEANQVDQEVELFCNKVAAEFLVPHSEFLRDWREVVSAEDRLYQLAREYRVSTAVILRRALELGQLTRSEYFQNLEDERQRHLKLAKGGSGGDFRRNLYARNSSPLVNAVFESVLNGRTLYREAANILEVKSSTLSNMASAYPFFS